MLMKYLIAYLAFREILLSFRVARMLSIQTQDSFSTTLHTYYNFGVRFILPYDIFKLIKIVNWGDPVKYYLERILSKTRMEMLKSC